ncbi:MAG: hypothetical protein JST47_10080 [Bacteroidetes bacterium]|nr:hypothetical protein [Bacteroidota bacterium]
MKYFFYALCVFAFTEFSEGCSSSAKMRAAYVPFTKQLKDRLEGENVDIKQVQFYVDQKLIMSRYLDNDKAQVTSGVVKLENGRYVNEVVVPPFTPGVCEDIVNGNLMVNFEKGSSDLGFGLGSNYSAGQYVLYGYDWKNGTAVVNFDNQKFRVRCGTCPDVASARLLIRKNVVDKFEKKTRVLEGRKVDQ